MIFERAEGPAAYPMITAALTDEGTPLGWGALSALAAGDEAGKLFAASDSVYSGQPSIFTIDATQTPALIIRQAGRHPQRRSGPEDRHRRHRRRRRRRLLAGQ